MKERDIQVEVLPEGKNVRINVSGVSDISSHRYDSLQSAISATKNRLNVHEGATVGFLFVGLEVMAAGLHLIQKGSEINEPLISAVGGCVLLTGVSILLEDVRYKSRGVELSEELEQLVEIAKEQKSS